MNLEEELKKALEPEPETRQMHNLKLFRALAKQMEENLGKELDRLTTDNRLWKILSAWGLLPKRRITGYGFFIKHTKADIKEIGREYFREAKKLYQKLDVERLEELEDFSKEDDNGMDSL